ncbi:MAG: hypothetical protein ACLUGA_13140 [Oscillospiraceae bacterium]
MGHVINGAGSADFQRATQSDRYGVFTILVSNLVSIKDQDNVFPVRDGNAFRSVRDERHNTVVRCGRINGRLKRRILRIANHSHLIIRQRGGGEKGRYHQDGQKQRQDGLLHWIFLPIFFCFQSLMLVQAPPVPTARGTPCSIYFFILPSALE